MNTTNRSLYSLHEAAVLLNIDINSVKILIESGQIRTYQIRGELRIPKSDLDGLIEKLERGSRLFDFEGIYIHPDPRHPSERTPPPGPQHSPGPHRIVHSSRDADVTVYPSKWLIPGFNSIISETFSDAVDNISSLDEIKDTIRELDADYLEYYEYVRDIGITDIPTFVQMMVHEEVIRRLLNIKELLLELHREKAAIILPLPPYILEIISCAARADWIFQSQKTLQDNLKRINQIPLDIHSLPKITETISSIETLIIDGKKGGNRLFIRSNVALLIRSLTEKNLRKIFFHKIPHIPRDENFTNYDISEYDVEIKLI